MHRPAARRPACPCRSLCRPVCAALVLCCTIALTGQAAHGVAEDGPGAVGQALPAVTPGRPLTFPRDFGAHPAYRIEWWYLTGRLDDGEQQRGFQITFFRLRPQWQEDLATPLAVHQLVFAHAALADPRAGRLLRAERRARAGFGQGAAESDTDIRLGPWRLTRVGTDGEYYLADAHADDFSLGLRLRPQGGPVLHGDAGYSRKGRDGARASYYYSRPQLIVEGTLTLGGRTRAVSGRAWLDHEWSSALMPAEAVGWDWLGVNMADGGALMVFRLRNADGNPVWAGGTRWHPGQPPRVLGPGEVSFTSARRWRSPRTGIAYPVEQAILAGGEHYRVRPIFDDQELDARASVGAIYWEGAVDLERAGRRLGQGYLEMTGYERPLRW